MYLNLNMIIENKTLTTCILVFNLFASYAVASDLVPSSKDKSNLRRAQSIIYEDVPDLSKEDIEAVMDWITAEVTMEKNPFCWKHSYGRGVGEIPGRVADCPSGYTNHGLTCHRGSKDIYSPSKTASCPSEYTNTGLTCFRPAHTYSAPSKSGKCPRGYSNTGLTCHR